jgi:glucose dehydrogenase
MLSGESKGRHGLLFGGGVSFDNGRIYATSGLGDVEAIDANTGALIWRARPGGPLRGAPTIANDSVYVMSQDNQLFALNPADGKVRWNAAGTFEVSGVFGVAAPAAAQGRWSPASPRASSPPIDTRMAACSGRMRSPARASPRPLLRFPTSTPRP